MGFPVVANELYIADLGYWKVACLAELAAQGAYFISRYKTANVLYYRTQQGIYEVFDLNQILRFVRRPMEFEVYLGEQKLAVRLMIEPVSEEIKQQRLKKVSQKIANQSKQKKTYQMSQLKRQLCGYNIFVTNVAQDVLSRHQIRDFYRLRWQIELLFKIWKSILKMNQIKLMSLARFECYLYAKLMILLISTEIQVYLKNHFIQQSSGRLEMSEWKTMKILHKRVSQIWDALIENQKDTFDKILQKIILLAGKMAKKDARIEKDGFRKLTPFQIVNALA
jgi:hypothetical protein